MTYEPGKPVCDTSSPEWLEERRKLVTGSALSVIMGMSPYQSRESLMKFRVRGGVLPDNRKMWWGRHMEEPVGFSFCRAVGFDAVHTPVLFSHGSLGASLDFIVNVKEDKTVPLSLLTSAPTFLRKELNRLKKGDILPMDVKVSGQPVGKWRKLPEHYWCQVQAQMLVCGVDKGSLVAKLGAHDVRFFVVERDDMFLDEAEQKAQEFLREYQERKSKAEAL